MLQEHPVCKLTKVGEVGMVIDGSLRLDTAEQQHCNVGVHEEDQHEQRPNVVEGRQGNDECCQQRLQPLQATLAIG